MSARLRVELQAEVRGSREVLFSMVASVEGLVTWLDGAEMAPRVGSPVRLRLRDSTAVGRVLAVDSPQHISWTWDWEAEPLGITTVLSFDLIDHADRTHITLRHVGFRSVSQVQMHDALWRYWFARLVAAADRAQPNAAANTSQG